MKVNDNVVKAICQQLNSPEFIAQLVLLGYEPDDMIEIFTTSLNCKDHQFGMYISDGEFLIQNFDDEGAGALTSLENFDEDYKITFKD